MTFQLKPDMAGVELAKEILPARADMPISVPSQSLDKTLPRQRGSSTTGPLAAEIYWSSAGLL